jgi:hypothetical protein
VKLDDAEEYQKRSFSEQIGVPLFTRVNGLRYLRWGGDGEAVQPEKG